MFENVFISDNQNELGQPFDYGQLAESLVFYKHTRVMTDEHNISNLVQKVGIGQLIDLISAGHLTLSCIPGVSAILNEEIDKVTAPVHLWTVGLTNEKRQRLSIEELIASHGEVLLGDKWLAKRIAKKITPHLEKINHKKLEELRKTISKKTIATICDPDVSATMIKEFARRRFGLSDFKVNSPVGFPADDGFIFNPATDFAALHTSKDGQEFTPTTAKSTFALSINQACEDLFFSGYWDSPMKANELSSTLMRKLSEDIIGRITKDDGNIHSFQQSIFSNGVALREAINSGERNFSEVITLVEKAEPFKKWLSLSPQDHNLIEEYLREIRSKPILEKLPNKVIRFFGFNTTAGLAELLLGGGVGMAGGLALSLFDTFFLEKLVNRWRPNHFVDGPLTDFVTKPGEVEH